MSGKTTIGISQGSSGSLQVTGSVTSTQLHAFPLTPLSGSVFTFQVLSASTVQTVLNASRFALMQAISGGNPLVHKTDVDCLYRWSTASAGTTLDPTETTGSAAAQYLFARERSDDTVPVGMQSILTYGISSVLTGTLRIHVS